MDHRHRRGTPWSASRPGPATCGPAAFAIGAEAHGSGRRAGGSGRRIRTRLGRRRIGKPGAATAIVSIVATGADYRPKISK